MVGLTAAAHLHVHFSMEGSLGVGGQFLCKVYWQVVLALGVEYLHLVVASHEYALVAYLTTHFGIERSLVEHQFVVSLLFLLHAAVAQNVAVALRYVPTLKVCFTFGKDYPVVGFNSRSVAGTFLLLLHFGVKAFLVNLHAIFVADEFSQVERETISVEQCKGLFAFNHRLAFLLGLCNHVFKHVDTS